MYYIKHYHRESFTTGEVDTLPFNYDHLAELYGPAAWVRQPGAVLTKEEALILVNKWNKAPVRDFAYKYYI